MADGPWQCSTCGTVNEPVANSCRTCGKWPSLFDLQDNIVDDVELEDAREPAPAAGFPPQPRPYEPEVFEREAFEPQEPFELEPLETEPFESGRAPDDEPERSSRPRQLASFIVPLAFVVYLVISIVFGDR